MALDTQHLTPTELIRLVNSTPAGPVLNPAKVNRQMNAAGLRLGDGRTIHLVKYVAWLVHEHDRPRPEKLSVKEARARDLKAKNAARREAQDIGEIPAVVDPERRQTHLRQFGRSLRAPVVVLQGLTNVFSAGRAKCSAIK